MDELLAVGRHDFPNGWSIDIDEIWRGQVLYRLWPPGVKNQGLFDRTYRRPIHSYLALAREAMNASVV
jgi:hypothetical protein